MLSCSQSECVYLRFSETEAANAASTRFIAKIEQIGKTLRKSIPIATKLLPLDLDARVELVKMLLALFVGAVNTILSSSKPEDLDVVKRHISEKLDEVGQEKSWIDTKDDKTSSKCNMFSHELIIEQKQSKYTDCTIDFVTPADVKAVTDLTATTEEVLAVMNAHCDSSIRRVPVGMPKSGELPWPIVPITMSIDNHGKFGPEWFAKMQIQF